ncbi:hypothetical protein DICVIV_09501 [Dictyocaulus viviparus]|uniref:Uncharacterized protein n=1 Tax=Dictyocaulus viviparus TaxID=29172 RepID=A0A0D8XIN8_DICVI|nr:hypothetical protein DICVIV_09501 [Dictyocaulus viviparus]
MAMIPIELHLICTFDVDNDCLPSTSLPSIMLTCVEYLNDFVDEENMKDEKKARFSMLSSSTTRSTGIRKLKCILNKTIAKGKANAFVKVENSSNDKSKDEQHLILEANRREDSSDSERHRFHSIQSTSLSSYRSQSHSQKLQQRKIHDHDVQQQNRSRVVEYDDTETRPTSSSTGTRTSTTTSTTTNDTSFVYQKDLIQMSNFSPHRSAVVLHLRHQIDPQFDSLIRPINTSSSLRYENIILDHRPHEDDEERRRHEKELQREQLKIIERARAQAEDKIRSNRQNVTRPRAWLQVDSLSAADNQSTSSFLRIRNYRPFDLNDVPPSDVSDRSSIISKAVNVPLNVLHFLSLLLSYDKYDNGAD